MKKRLISVAIVLLTLCMAFPAFAGLQDMSATVHKWTGGYNQDGSPGLTRVTSGITFMVLAIGTDTAETLYYPNGSTSLTNPVTTTNFGAATVCNDMVAFRVDPTDATNDRYVDLIVTDTNGGYSVFVEDFDKYTHTIIIDEQPNVVHQGTIWFSASSAVETDTGIDFLPYTLIHDVLVDVTIVDAGEDLDVGLLSSGTGGDADGFRDAVSVATLGFVADTGVITAGDSIDYTAVSTYGALLYTAITGTGTYTTEYTQGGRSYLGHVVTGANTGALTYTGSSGSDTAAGFIHYWFTRMR